MSVPEAMQAEIVAWYLVLVALPVALFIALYPRLQGARWWERLVWRISRRIHNSLGPRLQPVREQIVQIHDTLLILRVRFPREDLEPFSIAFLNLLFITFACSVFRKLKQIAVAG